jgi:EAL domain-containing protein (putative c-di-GMP-specific phosphodiesterase class I)
VSALGSIGIALSGDHGSTPEELLRNADLAMYLAKARGKNRHELYEPGMHEQAMRRLSMKAELERALANDELDVHYQPIVSLHDGSVIGLEALLRWRGPDGQFVAVPEIIAIAEETGLILPIGRFVMERACRDARRWQEEMGADEKLDIAINVSIVQLENGTLIQDVDRALAESGLPPTSLVLEITESALSTDSLDSVRTIRALRARGIRLALDDFGTGYSSLARLRRFPVDIVKIDRSFVTAINKSREGVLVQSILDLGRSLEMEVVAEGIETEAQMLALRARGATLGQGYYFARPLQQDAVTTVLSIGKLPLPLKRRRTAVARGA